MGNIDDAISITVAVAIVLTGKHLFTVSLAVLTGTTFQSGFCTRATVGEKLGSLE